MQLQLTTKEQATALKELGFDWAVTGYFTVKDDVWYEGEGGVATSWNTFYNKEFCYSRPTVALAMLWLQKEKGLYVSICTISGFCKFLLQPMVLKNDTLEKLISFDRDVAEFSYFELCQSAGLDAALEYLKTK